jgi:erythromycin esterase-like protein
MLLLCSALPSHAQQHEWEDSISEGLRPGALVQVCGSSLGQKDLLLIGEAPHNTAEIPFAMVSTIIPDLQDLGYRTYLSEYAHAYGWLADMYVRGELDLVILKLHDSEFEYRDTWGDRWYELVLDVVTVEHESAVYRSNQERTAREETMLTNVRNALRATHSPTVLVVGANHAQRTPPAAMNSRETTLGSALSNQFSTYHVMAYALAGTQIRHFSATSVQQFDNRQRYSPANLGPSISEIELGVADFHHRVV